MPLRNCVPAHVRASSLGDRPRVDEGPHLESASWGQKEHGVFFTIWCGGGRLGDGCDADGEKEERVQAQVHFYKYFDLEDARRSTVLRIPFAVSVGHGASHS